MRIDIKRINNAVNLEATNETGVKLMMDGSESIGGQNLGMRPMQLLLASLGGCSSMDVLSILKKMQQDVVDYQVVVNGNRDTDVVPSLFKSIEIKFIVKGNNLDVSKVNRAVELSITKYCSVVKTLEPTCAISYLVEIH